MLMYEKILEPLKGGIPSYLGSHQGTRWLLERETACRLETVNRKWRETETKSRIDMVEP